MTSIKLKKVLGYGFIVTYEVNMTDDTLFRILPEYFNESDILVSSSETKAEYARLSYILHKIYGESVCIIIRDDYNYGHKITRFVSVNTVDIGDIGGDQYMEHSGEIHINVNNVTSKQQNCLKKLHTFFENCVHLSRKCFKVSDIKPYIYTYN